MVLAFIAGVTVVIASQSNYTASAFSQFCAQNSSICAKVDFKDARIGATSCPSNTQVITNIYVHAGSGQTVYELPDSLFLYAYSNSQNTVTVTALQGTKDISWIGVTCTQGTNPSPTPTNTPTPTITPTPTSTPTATPTPTDRPTVTPTPTDDVECNDCGGQISTPTPTPTNTPTPTVVNNPTATPTPGSSNNTPSSSTNNPIGGQVLGAATPTTLAATGSASEIVSNGAFILGVLLTAVGAVNHAKKTKKVSFQN